LTHGLVWIWALIWARAVGGVFSALTSPAAAPPPASPAALTAGALATASLAAAGIAGTGLSARRLVSSGRRLVAAWRLVGALDRFRPGCLIGTRRLGPRAAGTALCLRGAFGAARCRFAAVLAARPSVASRVPRSVAPHVAISVAISAITISIPIAAAAPAAIAIVTRIATAKPVALGLRGRGRGGGRGGAGTASAAKQPTP
jgi:hypothetical protein